MSALLNQAVQAHQAGKFVEAADLYQQVLAQQPDNADALALLGTILDDAGQSDAALSLIDRAIALDPGAALFQLYRGNALTRKNDHAGAAQAFASTIALNPQMVQAHYNLGNAQRALKDWDGAEKSYASALALQPSFAAARNNLALVYAHRENYAEAVRELQRVVQDDPGYADGWLNLCNYAEKKGDYALAVQVGEKATKLLPDNASAWLGFGVALNRNERHEEAITAYQTALKLRPEWIDAWDNLGQSYQFLNMLDEAEATYHKVIDLAGQSIPDDEILTIDERKFGDRHWHLSLIELVKGDYLHGWARYRARFNALNGLKRMDWAQPYWRGEDLRGKKLLVMDEQGMGDCLMMIRYLPLLRAQGVYVKFLVKPAFAPYFRGWDGVDEVVVHKEPLGDFDVYSWIFDLAYCFHSTLANTPNTVPYLPVLEPDAETKLPQNGKLRVGVVWGGSPLHKHDYRRSVPLRLFAELFSVEGVEFYSLNRDLREGDTDILAEYKNVTNLAPRLRHFGDLGRFVQQMDLVISCDTATAHLSGGMAKKVWTLLPFCPDWRWLTDRSDSPWYPTMRLFRQSKSGDWNGVIAQVKKELAAKAASA